MKARIVWLIFCGIWGSTWLFIKLGLEDLPPFTFAGIRFVIACAIVIVIIRIRGIALPRARADWIFLAVTGILSFGFNYGLVFWGEQYITSGLAALLQATLPAFGLVFAHFHLPGERLSWARIGGVVLGVCGVAVVFFKPTQSVRTSGVSWLRGIDPECGLRCLFECPGKGTRKKPESGDLDGRSDVLRFVTATRRRHPTRRQSVPIALDANGCNRSVVSCRGRFRDRFYALLLARAENGRHEVDVNSFSDTRSSSIPRHDRPQRGVRLAHPRRRRDDHAWHRVDRFA